LDRQASSVELNGHALELARHMAEAVPTTLVSFGNESKEERIGSLRVRTVGQPWHVRGQSTNPFSFSVFKEFRDADVVHCHQQHVLMSSVTAAWCRATGRHAFVSDLGGGGWDISAYVSTDTWFDGHLHISDAAACIARRLRTHVMVAVSTRTSSPRIQPFRATEVSCSSGGCCRTRALTT
jgi:hypothetical protein